MNTFFTNVRIANIAELETKQMGGFHVARGINGKVQRGREIDGTGILNRFVPDDVDLIEVIEMIADCVCAGRARNKDGTIYPITISENVLMQAFTNTVTLFADAVTVVEQK